MIDLSTIAGLHEHDHTVRAAVVVICALAIGTGCATAPPEIPVLNGSYAVRIFDWPSTDQLAGCKLLGSVDVTDGEESGLIQRTKALSIER